MKLEEPSKNCKLHIRAPRKRLVHCSDSSEKQKAARGFRILSRLGRCFSRYGWFGQQVRFSHEAGGEAKTIDSVNDLNSE